jgi:hypothetical protein
VLSIIAIILGWFKRDDLIKFWRKIRGKEEKKKKTEVDGAAATAPKEPDPESGNASSATH